VNQPNYNDFVKLLTNTLYKQNNWPSIISVISLSISSATPMAFFC